jgi:hypothetical protein
MPDCCALVKPDQCNSGRCAVHVHHALLVLGMCMAGAPITTAVNISDDVQECVLRMEPYHVLL